MSINLPSTVLEFIRTNDLLEPHQPILVGVSGGLDSIVLADVLIKLGFQVSIAHVNYQYRPESKKEALFVQKLAENYQVPFYLHTRKADEQVQESNLQKQARTIRYHFFEQLKKETGVQKVAVAHHLDDQAETILYNLFNGTGLKGLRGMLPQNDSGTIRPLLGALREDIRAYALQKSLIWVEDSSNASNKYKRNRIRHEVLTRVSEIFPGYQQNIASAALRVQEQLVSREPATFTELDLQQYPMAVAMAWKVFGGKPTWEQLYAKLSDYGFQGRICEQIQKAFNSANEPKSYNTKEYQSVVDKNQLLVLKRQSPFLTAEPQLNKVSEKRYQISWNGIHGLELSLTASVKPALSRLAAFSSIEKKKIKELMRLYAVPSALRPVMPIVHCVKEATGKTEILSIGTILLSKKVKTAEWVRNE